MKYAPDSQMLVLQWLLKVPCLYQRFSQTTLTYTCQHSLSRSSKSHHHGASRPSFYLQSWPLMPPVTERWLTVLTLCSELSEGLDSRSLSALSSVCVQMGKVVLMLGGTPRERMFRNSLFTGRKHRRVIPPLGYSKELCYLNSNVSSVFDPLK